MILYKFKSLEGDNFQHALDMVVNNRIYLSSCEFMNDPREGGFLISEASEIIDRANPEEIDDLTKIGKLINSTRFTCFTTSVNNPLLWAHYAGGYTGVAFKYFIDEKKHNCKILPVIYDDQPILMMNDCLKMLNGELRPFDLGILRYKMKEWSYEREYRIFPNNNDDKYLNGLSPIGVIAGPRGLTYDSVFHQICRKYGVKTGDLVPSKKGYKVYFPLV